MSQVQGMAKMEIQSMIDKKRTSVYELDKEIERQLRFQKGQTTTADIAYRKEKDAKIDYFINKLEDQKLDRCWDKAAVMIEDPRFGEVMKTLLGKNTNLFDGFTDVQKIEVLSTLYDLNASKLISDDFVGVTRADIERIGIKKNLSDGWFLDLNTYARWGRNGLNENDLQIAHGQMHLANNDMVASYIMHQMAQTVSYKTFGPYSQAPAKKYSNEDEFKGFKFDKASKGIGNIVKNKPTVNKPPIITSENNGNTQTFYQATSKESVAKIMSEGKLAGQEFKEVYAWSKQPTLKQVQNSGARSFETVIKFEANPNTFIRDESIAKNLQPTAKISTRPGPISISNVQEVGFKKEWWEFWKK